MWTLTYPGRLALYLVSWCENIMCSIRSTLPVFLLTNKLIHKNPTTLGKFQDHKIKVLHSLNTFCSFTKTQTTLGKFSEVEMSFARDL